MFILAFDYFMIYLYPKLWPQVYNANVSINSAASLHIDYPMLFELRNNAAERVSHCGVLEFIAEEGMIYMPYWVGGVEKCFVFLLRNLE